MAGLNLPDPVVAAPGLAAVLSTVTDPRKRRGVRHGLVTLLSVAVCAVAAGARSFVAIAEWAADLPVEAAAALGIHAAAPSESACAGWCNGWTPTGSTPRSASGSSN
jgi:DDE_Tnp_1-associated